MSKVNEIIVCTPTGIERFTGDLAVATNPDGSLFITDIDNPNVVARIYATGHWNTVSGKFTKDASG